MDPIQKFQFDLMSLRSLGDRHWLADSARGVFLDIACELNPKVYTDLRDTVRPVFEDTLDGLGDRAPSPPPTLSTAYGFGAALVTWYRDCISADDDVVDSLRGALIEWMEKYRMHAPWVADTALYTLGSWKLDPTAFERWHWVVPGESTGEEREPRETVTLRLPTAYDLVLQSAGEIRTKYMDALSNLLDSWLSEIKGRARELGLSTVEPGDTEDHIRWVVRLYVCRDSIYEIAADAERDRRTVKEAIARMSQYLDLPELPSDPPGRPRGSKTKRKVHY